jgi:hypothetical protein
MIARLTVVILAAIAGLAYWAARAQTFDFCLAPGNQALSMCPAKPAPIYDDGTDVGRAMAICARHEVYPNVVYLEGGTPTSYARDWEACYKVRESWWRSEAARQFKAEQEQIERDRAFVGSVRDGLQAEK